MDEMTLESWQALYRVAVDFKQQAPWRSLANEELFAVEDPATGEVGYCSVMGSGAQEFGLAVFIGADGFEAYCELTTGDSDPRNPESPTDIHALTAMFVDREFLERQDREVIRTLGLRFRGRGAWPWFRSHRPGYVPWFLDQPEVGFLTAALSQAMQVAPRVRTGELRLPPGVDSGQVLTRCYRQGGWTEEWRPLDIREPALPEEPVDALRLRRLRLDAARGTETWAVDFFLLPAAIGPARERPYYPCAMLVSIRMGSFSEPNCCIPPLGRTNAKRH